LRSSTHPRVRRKTTRFVAVAGRPSSAANPILLPLGLLTASGAVRPYECVSGITLRLPAIAFAANHPAFGAAMTGPQLAQFRNGSAEVP
jgi:hypothetical protein